METATKAITVSTTVHAPIEKVWQYWTAPEHITQWNYASDDWHTPRAQNDLRTGGRFSARMEAKDGSMGFDFGGVYDQVEPSQLIRYTLEDGRKVSVRFQAKGAETEVVETFDPEGTHSLEMQQAGWQAILDHFKQYVERS